jgi:hypothetical protein
MRNLDEIMMRSLSFPDFNVEKMEFLPEQKILKVFVEGAWLGINGGTVLGKGVLFFNDWDVSSISRYDPILEKWYELEISNSEELRDLCEVKFSNSNISLCGFGKKLGQWLEWKISNAKMHAEFETK